MQNIELWQGNCIEKLRELIDNGVKVNSVICDIPYKNTKQYGSSKNFDYDRFWDWAEKMSEKNIVLVSEHEAPLGWECIWQQEVKRTIDNNKRVNAVEKLFELRE